MSLRRLPFLIVTACLICFTAGTAHAQYSLDLSGAKNMWFYGSYGQLGSRGFFGDYNVDASSTGGFAALNGWVGNQADIGNLVSGSNAGSSSINLKITPKYGNDWAKLQARYTINTYNTSAAPGSVTPLSPGQLTLWSAAVGTPLGTIRVGKQVFRQGCSLQFSDVRTSEYLMLDRTYSVPDILGCLVGLGVLPRKAMSWFNPHLWPRYRPTKYKPSPFDNPNYTEPEDELYRHPTKNKSVFKVWEDEQLACLKKRRDCFQTYKKKPGDTTVCGEPLEPGQDPGDFAKKRVEDLNEEIQELACRIAEQQPDTEVKKGSEMECYIGAPDAAKEDKDKCTRELDKSYAWGHIGPACLRIGFGFFPWETPDFNVEILNPLTGIASRFPATSWNQFDLGVNRVQNWISLIAYSSTDLEFGIGCLRSNYHQGPEAIKPSPGAPPLPAISSINTPTFERYLTEGWAYLKYNNGRIFFNTELDWFNRVFRFQRSLNGTFFGIPDNVDGSGSRFASQYRESWRYMAEAGFWCGPFAAKALYSFMPGPDRRHGIYIDRQPFIQEDPQQAFGLFDPYSILLAYRFGSGVNAPGHISDASVYALRLEYALASNLILETSFLRALRNTHGYAVGYRRPNTAAASFGSVVYGEPPGSTFTNPAPSVPDGDLGWEVMGGFVWELMDGWAVETRASYWRPGRWFNYACIDRGVPNGNIPSAANNWGVRPDRAIDPVFGFEIQIITSY